MEGSFIIGNVGFNSESLKGITLTEAYLKFSHIQKEITKAAYLKVNPKFKKKKY